MLKGIYAIFATYFYFLLFAQFSFLDHVKESLAQSSITSIMAVMGVTGLVFSCLSIKLLTRFPAYKLISLSFFLCAFTSLLSIYVSSFFALSLVAALIGSSLALLTVPMASSLNQYFSRVGLFTGLGTGFAYFACNVPFIFAANVSKRAAFVSIVTAIGGTLFLKASKQDYTYAYKMLSPWRILLCFVALVWFDCAAFYVIQNAGHLRSLTWEGSYHLWSNSLVHLLFAIIAGVLIDYGQLKLVLIGAFVFLAVGVLSLSGYSLISAPFYCAGVSFYSTALVTFPSLLKDKKIFFAGLTYAIAGWFGSAMGIGMAQDLNQVPVVFIVISGVFILAFLKFRS